MDIIVNLDRLFDELNQKYFSGKLRKRRVRWADWKVAPQSGLCTPRAIYIRRGLSSELVLTTLLHEMCHIGTGKGHGSRFFAALARLKAMGAPLGAPDRAPPSHWINPHRELPITIDDIASEPVFTTWRQVRRALARDLGISAALVERHYPWARKRWMHKRPQFQAYEHRVRMHREVLSQTE
jgi:WLM domain